jgi:hypothetical protein
MNASELPAVANFEEVEGYFSEVGISEDILIRAIRAGLRERNRVTKLHPVTAAGSRTWEDIIAEMRAGLLELEGSNWNYSHEKGLSLTHNKDAAITIVVSSGNKFTGIKEEKEKVKTKNAKGPSTLHYVGRNYTLFDDLENTDTNIQNIIANPNQTWVFLYHVDITEKEVS